MPERASTELASAIKKKESLMSSTSTRQSACRWFINETSRCVAPQTIKRHNSATNNSGRRPLLPYQRNTCNDRRNGRRNGTEVSFDGRGYHHVRHSPIEENNNNKKSLAPTYMSNQEKKRKKETKQPRKLMHRRERERERRDGTCVSRCHTRTWNLNSDVA